MLLAYSKMWLYDALLASEVPDDPLAVGLLVDYFRSRCASAIATPWHTIRCGARSCRPT